MTSTRCWSACCPTRPSRPRWQRTRPLPWPATTRAGRAGAARRPTCRPVRARAHGGDRGPANRAMVGLVGPVAAALGVAAGGVGSARGAGAVSGVFGGTQTLGERPWYGDVRAPGAPGEQSMGSLRGGTATFGSVTAGAATFGAETLGPAVAGSQPLIRQPVVRQPLVQAVRVPRASVRLRTAVRSAAPRSRPPTTTPASMWTGTATGTPVPPTNESTGESTSSWTATTTAGPSSSGTITTGTAWSTSLSSTMMATAPSRPGCRTRTATAGWTGRSGLIRATVSGSAPAS